MLRQSADLSASGPLGGKSTFGVVGVTGKSGVAQIEDACYAVPGSVDGVEPVAAVCDAATQDAAHAEDAVEPASAPADVKLHCPTLRERMRRFELYLPKPLTRWVLGSSNSARVAPAERQVTVMFTDIVGFTAMAEGQPAAAIAHFLNEHFALVAECVEREGGTIDKFIGDAVMAFWVASQQPDHETSACRAALAIARALVLDNVQRRARGEFAVNLRIGIHAGPAVVGSIGSPSRMNYTIVGDTVNTAQRLEQFGKVVADGERRVTAIVSQAVAARLPRGFRLTPLGPVALRGRHDEIIAYRLHTSVSGGPPGQAEGVEAD